MSGKVKGGSRSVGPSTQPAVDNPGLPMLKLRSGDGAVFPVSVEAAKMSKIVRQLIDDLSEEGARPIDWSKMEIPLANVSGHILRKIIVWMDYHHRTDPPGPEKEEDDLTPFTEDISEWDENFVKVDQSTLFELILATNYLNLKPLRTVCCKTVANTLKKKSVEQIREMYNIKNDFTPEEEEELRKENEWCEKH